MMGLICYRDAGEKNGTRMLCGVNFCAVYVTRGEGVLAQLSAKRAVKYLKKRCVRQAVFPKGYPNAPVFARLGILPPDERPLRQVKTAAIVRCAMGKLGLRAEHARIALIADRLSAALEASAISLARDVRYLMLCAPGDAHIARAIRWDCGASVSVCARENIRADLAAVFSGIAPRCRCPVLELENAALGVSYGAENLPPEAVLWEENDLLCALYLSGALREESLSVKDVIFPAKAAENAKLP